MIRRIFYLFVLFSLFLSCNKIEESSVESGTVNINDSRINDYALYDEQGNMHRFSTYNDKKAIILFVQGNDCPIVRNSLADFNEIVNEYRDLGFQFFMINSNINDNRKSIAKESKDFGFIVPVLKDESQILADAFDIKVTSEIIILHPVSREVIFRGPVNNRLDFESQKQISSENYLQETLDDILKGIEPVSKKGIVKGCYITRLSSLESDTLTYTKNIAPILINSCVRCHIDGGVAPWSMTDYEKIVGWSAMIEQVLISKRMPPWKADPEVGDFSNSFAVPENDRRKILRWIKGGMPLGIGEDPLKNLSPIDMFSEDVLIKSDTTIVLNKEIIPANGIIDYRHQNIKLNLPKGKWLAGLKIVVGNPKIVHHLSVASSSKSKIAVDRPSRDWIDNIIAVIAGGTSNLFMFPEDAGIYMDSQTELYIQTHYVTTGREEEDISSIILYFHDDEPSKEYSSLSVWADNFNIKPFERNKQIIEEDVITEDIIVYSVFPHMHYRGRNIKIMAIKPSGEILDLVSVPDFDFNWQIRYIYKEPIYLPKGTIIRVKGIYDNSFQNPLNPDPSKAVKFGLKSTDEMFMGIINYTLAD